MPATNDLRMLMSIYLRNEPEVSLAIPPAVDLESNCHHGKMRTYLIALILF